MRKTFFLFCICIAALLTAAAQAELRISEICPSNHCAYFDADGDTPDWVELWNDGEEELPLDGWYLSDDRQGKHLLPLAGVIPAGGFSLAEISDAAGFKLSASGETVYLLKDGDIYRQAQYPAMEQDAAYALLDGAYAVTYLPTPSMENALLKKDEPYHAETGVRLNEIITSAAPYQDGEGYDYVELFNSGKNKQLAGWQLRLGMAGSKSIVFPEKSLENGKYYVIYCTDEDTKKPHTGFNLPAQGALISLWRPDGTLADFIRLPLQYANVSYGVGSDGALGYLGKQSPGRKNGTAYAKRAEQPKLSLPGGVYEGDELTVEITGPEGAEIRYTTNGELPDQSDALYTGPLTLDRTTALRAVAFAEGALPSESVSATYVLGLEADFPVVCLIIDPYYLYDRHDGAFSGMTGEKHNYLMDWEYPANLEYFDSEGQSLINQACGFGVQGDSSRGQKQKGLQLVARKSYGTPEVFAFNPFENRDFSSYKSFNLRAAGSEGPINVRYRDAALSTLAEGTHMLYSAAQPVLVYLNGKIYGHFNLRERINKYFIAQHEGVAEQEIDQIDILSETGEWVRNGSSADYLALSRFMKENDLNIPENLEYVLERMDVDSYFEYVVFMMATGNKDLSNSRFYRVPGGKWKWLLYDLDRGLEAADNEAAFWLYSLDIRHAKELLTDHVPFAALMKVPQMRDKFFVLLGEFMATRFAPDSLIALIDDWHDRVVSIMPYQLEIWTQDNMHYWESLVEKMRVCAQKRPEMVVQYAQRYFRLTDEEVRRYFGELPKENKQ